MKKTKIVQIEKIPKEVSENRCGEKRFLLGVDEQGWTWYLREGVYKPTSDKWNDLLFSPSSWVFGHFDAVDERGFDKYPTKDFEAQFLRGNGCKHKKLMRFFDRCTFTEREAWEILELMHSYYTAIDYAIFIQRGGTNYTHNYVCENFRDEAQAQKILTEIIPAITQKIYEILSKEAE